jgi:UDP-N-acetylmuramate dehydrogenase
MSEWSAGCVFKNPHDVSAGRLLDQCGLKGLKLGDAEVSERHANFIINRGDAVAADVLRLIGIMKAAVRREFGIELELEVRHWPARSRAA